MEYSTESKLWCVHLCSRQALRTHEHGTQIFACFRFPQWNSDKIVASSRFILLVVFRSLHGILSSAMEYGLSVAIEVTEGSMHTAAYLINN